jgi:hypothetical protein
MPPYSGGSLAAHEPSRPGAEEETMRAGRKQSIGIPRIAGNGAIASFQAVASTATWALIRG